MFGFPAFLLSLLLLHNPGTAFASPHAPARAAAPLSGRGLSRPPRRAASEFVNPLIASLQVKADNIRKPKKAKRACPSYLPNGNCACPDGTTYCSDSDECINLSGSDPNNCGGCGAVCGQNQACFEYECLSCDTLTSCGSSCVDTQTELDNCGACGNVCAPGYTTCMGGVCTCPFGFSTCVTTCDTDTSSDVYNCGTCRNYCGEPPEASCGMGQCQCDGILCNDICFNEFNDSNNCGSCGHLCPADQPLCVNAGCSCDPSMAGSALCGNECIDITYNANNCGSCGFICPGAASCGGGMCICNDSGATVCGNECVFLTSDSNNCGSCGTQCDLLSEYCSGGSCVPGCDYGLGYYDCAGDGVCIDFLTDASNCETCGHVCLAGQICSGGVCM